MTASLHEPEVVETPTENIVVSKTKRWAKRMLIILPIVAICGAVFGGVGGVILKSILDGTQVSSQPAATAPEQPATVATDQPVVPVQPVQTYSAEFSIVKTEGPNDYSNPSCGDGTTLEVIDSSGKSMPFEDLGANGRGPSYFWVKALATGSYTFIGTCDGHKFEGSFSFLVDSFYTITVSPDSTTAEIERKSW